MNTPRTDANDLGWQFNEQYGDFDALSDTPMPWLDFSKMLEEELTAVTEQRDSIDSMYHKVIKEVLECDPIPACKRDYDQLESPWEVIARVREQRDRLAEALQNIKNELGVPQPEYPSPVANAYEIADEALQSLNQPNHEHRN